MNITNAKLEALMLANLAAIVAAFDAHDYVELGRVALVIHA